MGYLQDLYQGDREIFAHNRRDDRDLAESLRRRGYHVAIHEYVVYGKQTDAVMGSHYEIKGVALGEYAATELKAHDGDDEYGESRVYTLDPIKEPEDMTVDELYEELAPHYPEANAGRLRGDALSDEEIPF